MSIRLFVRMALVTLPLAGLGWRAGVAHSRVASPTPSTPGEAPFDARIRAHADKMLDEGRKIFRFDTFGDEAF